MEVFDFRSYESDKENNRNKRFMIALLVGASFAGLALFLSFALA